MPDIRSEARRAHDIANQYAAIARGFERCARPEKGEWARANEAKWRRLARRCLHDPELPAAGGPKSCPWGAVLHAVAHIPPGEAPALHGLFSGS